MQPKSLRDSKYAPKTPIQSLAISQAEKLKQDKEKATRLLARLRWKAESLAVSYLRALEIWQVEVGQKSHEEGLRYTFLPGTSSKQAISMFKVDFFEFYTLLERYITLCLSILGVNVSSTAPRTNVNALRFITNPDRHRMRPEASHAFHANLLEAIDQESCPLHVSLGNQDVRIQLGLAKDYRNAWKDADDVRDVDNLDGESRKRAKLEDLDLDKMLMLLLAGCEHAHGVVQRHTVSNLNGVTSKDFETQAYPHQVLETDIPIEYMDDAMDLD